MNFHSRTLSRVLVGLGLAGLSAASFSADLSKGETMPQTHEAFSFEGLWFETANYPASSVLRFLPYGKGWIGQYVQVSPPQQRIGFRVGETVIRGTVSGPDFVGEVLLKPLQEYPVCIGLTVGWVPIRMSLDGSKKLTGRWLQSWTADNRGCVVVGQSWQPYSLERLPAH